MPERPYPWEDVDMDAAWGRDADGRFYVRCCCDWFTSSLDPRQILAAQRSHAASCIDAITADIEQQNLLERILGAGSIEEMNAIWDGDDPPPGETWTD